jgi:hypothetical protein
MPRQFETNDQIEDTLLDACRAAVGIKAPEKKNV